MNSDDNSDHEVLKPEIVGQPEFEQHFNHPPEQYQQPGAQVLFDSTSDTGAILALSLAISSWIVLPVIGAIAALIVAPGARRRIKASHGSTAIVTAAQVISILNLIAFAFLVWLFIAFWQWVL